MKLIIAIIMLLINFIKAAFYSGLDTAKIILLQPENVQGGLIAISYGDLNENTASLLGAMITLTPGTTLIDIDCESGMLLLHLLDLGSEAETMNLIERNFCQHLKILNEVMS